MEQKFLLDGSAGFANADWLNMGNAQRSRFCIVFATVCRVTLLTARSSNNCPELVSVGWSLNWIGSSWSSSKLGCVVNIGEGVVKVADESVFAGFSLKYGSSVVANVGMNPEFWGKFSPELSGKDVNRSLQIEFSASVPVICWALVFSTNRAAALYKLNKK